MTIYKVLANFVLQDKFWEEETRETTCSDQRQSDDTL